MSMPSEAHGEPSERRVPAKALPRLLTSGPARFDGDSRTSQSCAAQSPGLKPCCGGARDVMNISRRGRGRPGSYSCMRVAEIYTYALAEKATPAGGCFSPDQVERLASTARSEPQRQNRALHEQWVRLTYAKQADRHVPCLPYVPRMCTVSPSPMRAGSTARRPHPDSLPHGEGAGLPTRTSRLEVAGTGLPLPETFA